MAVVFSFSNLPIACALALECLLSRASFLFVWGTKINDSSLVVILGFHEMLGNQSEPQVGISVTVFVSFDSFNFRP